MKVAPKTTHHLDPVRPRGQEAVGLGLAVVLSGGAKRSGLAGAAAGPPAVSFDGRNQHIGRGTDGGPGWNPGGGLGRTAPSAPAGAVGVRGEAPWARRVLLLERSSPYFCSDCVIETVER